ncbi:hypothetical protein [Granulimonas faecalis]|uniref:hypothetical protein n=1 Tax=Granulimonas faecalis TaxID=2894155 RepID=UPI00351313C4
MSAVVSFFSFADKSTSCFVVFDRVCQGVVKNGLKKALLGKAYPAFKPVVQTGRSCSCERKRDAMEKHVSKNSQENAVCGQRLKVVKAPVAVRGKLSPSALDCGSGGSSHSGSN